MGKRKLVIVITVLAVAAFAGGAIAATQSSKQNTRRAYLNDVAKRLNVTPAQLQSALKGAALDQLNAAVKAGKLSQAQANALKQRIQKAPAGAPFLGPPPPGARGMGPVGPGRAHAFVAPVAKYLGLTPAKLRAQLRSGKSLSQIAKAQGKTTAGLEATITSSVKAKLDKAVANKRITAAQEQKLLSKLSARIEDLINGTPPKGLRFGGRAFGYHGMRGGFARPGSLAPAPPAPAGPVA